MSVTKAQLCIFRASSPEATAVVAAAADFEMTFRIKANETLNSFLIDPINIGKNIRNSNYRWMIGILHFPKF